MKEEMEKDERFIIRTYEKAELAHLYNPNMPLVSAMRKLRAWIRRNRQLTAEYSLFVDFFVSKSETISNRFKICTKL